MPSSICVLWSANKWFHQHTLFPSFSIYRIDFNSIHRSFTISIFNFILFGFFFFSIASKAISLINSSAGLILVLFPILFRIAGIPNSEWMLPLSMRVFFTNNKAHPGYELNYLFCTYSISISSWVFTGFQFSNSIIIISILLSFHALLLNCNFSLSRLFDRMWFNIYPSLHFYDRWIGNLFGLLQRNRIKGPSEIDESREYTQMSCYTYQYVHVRIFLLPHFVQVTLICRYFQHFLSFICFVLFWGFLCTLVCSYIKEVAETFSMPIVIQGFVSALSLTSTIFYAKYVTSQTFSIFVRSWNEKK